MSKNTLSNKLFHARVPMIATYTSEELSLYGIGVDINNGDISSKSHNEFSNVMITVDRMIDMFMYGYPIYIKNQKDSAEIYKILENYLNETTTDLQYSPNKKIVNDVRMEEIDKFANEMFNLNRNTIIKSNINITDGYDLGINMMSTPRVNNYSNPTVSRTGVLAGYNVDDDINEVQTPHVTYLNNTLPDIDISKINRRSLYKSNHMDGYDKY